MDGLISRAKPYGITDGLDAISRQEAIDAIESKYGIFIITPDIISTLESIDPAEPKRGKWIYHIDDLFPAESTMECDQCHAEQPLTCDDEFCPHCGAKMEVTE